MVGIPGKVFWAKLEYLGVVSAPVFFLLLALEYHGSERWLSRRKLFGLAVIPLITQDSQTQLRDTIARLKSANPIERQFFPTLAAYIQTSQRDYDLCITLDIAPTVKQRGFAPEVGAQLLNIIQEALTNIGQHAAQSVGWRSAASSSPVSRTAHHNRQAIGSRQPVG